MTEPMGGRRRDVRRTLTDSEARWEAVNLIAAAATDFVNGGAVVARGEAEGWTHVDVLAVENHVANQVDGLIFRHRLSHRASTETEAKVYRCQHGTPTATRLPSGTWIGHSQCWRCVLLRLALSRAKTGPFTDRLRPKETRRE